MCEAKKRKNFPLFLAVIPFALFTLIWTPLPPRPRLLPEEDKCWGVYSNPCALSSSLMETSFESHPRKKPRESPNLVYFRENEGGRAIRGRQSRIGGQRLGYHDSMNYHYPGLAQTRVEMGSGGAAAGRGGVGLEEEDHDDDDADVEFVDEEVEAIRAQQAATSLAVDAKLNQTRDGMEGLRKGKLEKIIASGDNSRHLRQPRRKRFVCLEWLDGCCSKGQTCEDIHQFDLERMPPCPFEKKYPSCTRKDCLFTHQKERVDMEDNEEELGVEFRRNVTEIQAEHNQKSTICPHFFRGFCFIGERCPLKHKFFHAPMPTEDRTDEWARGRLPGKYRKYWYSWQRLKPGWELEAMKSNFDGGGVNPDGTMFENLWSGTSSIINEKTLQRETDEEPMTIANREVVKDKAMAGEAPETGTSVMGPAHHGDSTRSKHNFKQPTGRCRIPLAVAL